MRQIPTLAFVASLAIVAACGGGDGGSDNGGINPGPGPGSISAGFLPDQPNPSGMTVSAAQGSASGDIVTVRINVTGTQDVFGAAFDVVFYADPLKVEYVGHAPGSLLEQGGARVDYTVPTPQQAGLLVVGAGRLGRVAGVDVAGTETIINLTFKVKARGTFPVTFQRNTLLDRNVDPIPNVTWFAGALRGV